jgi:hypothetical protein
MISLEAVILSFAPQALRLQLEESEKTDTKALSALQDKSAPNRGEAIRSWLQSYEVFQGIDGPKRPAIATAIVEWADARDIHRDLGTTDALEEVHLELAAVCVSANGESRDFASLASKALWLCYPDSVPIFDRFAQRALWVISKLEKDMQTLPESETEYKKFIYIWRAIYDRYAVTINSIEIGSYPYRVRIFDKILWLIGEPRYGLREPLGE